MVNMPLLVKNEYIAPWLVSKRVLCPGKFQNNYKNIIFHGLFLCNVAPLHTEPRLLSPDLLCPSILEYFSVQLNYNVLAIISPNIYKNVSAKFQVDCPFKIAPVH